jgi:hypothetical protein
MFSDFLIKYIFRQEEEFVVSLGAKTQKGSLFAVIKLRALWKEEPFLTKIKSIFSLQWKPNDAAIQVAAKKVFLNDIFGKENDFGEELLKLNIWHYSQDWDFDSLTEFDIARADALDAMTILTLQRYKKGTSIYLHLNLLVHTPFMCILVYPMIIKVPVISFQYFLNIQVRFAFNSIRKANHPQAEEIIAYLYEILYIQQKTSISLNEYLHLVDYANKHKGDALFINAEINAIMNADLVFSYLKASVEKIIVLIGLTHGILNLDSKKNHKSKLGILINGLPQSVLDVHYWKFILEFISSENLDELNNYRSGLLHKRGISDLQPHNYVKEKAEDIPLMKIFQVLHEQHSKNTAVLIGAFAILTDKLVVLDPPTIDISDIPLDFDINKLQKSILSVIEHRSP